MNLVSYADLAEMHLRDFVDASADIDVEESGMIGLIGLGGWERLGENMFGWRQGEPYHTAGVALEFGPESPLTPASADRIVQRLGLPVVAGMSAADLIAKFGSPNQDRPGRPGLRLLHFVSGQDERYRIVFFVDERGGLEGFTFVRKDYSDEDDSI